MKLTTRSIDSCIVVCRMQSRIERCTEKPVYTLTSLTLGHTYLNAACHKCAIDLESKFPNQWQVGDGNSL